MDDLRDAILSLSKLFRDSDVDCDKASLRFWAEYANCCVSALATTLIRKGVISTDAFYSEICESMKISMDLISERISISTGREFVPASQRTRDQQPATDCGRENSSRPG